MADLGCQYCAGPHPCQHQIQHQQPEGREKVTALCIDGPWAGEVTTQEGDSFTCLEYPSIPEIGHVNDSALSIEPIKEHRYFISVRRFAAKKFWFWSTYLRPNEDYIVGCLIGLAQGNAGPRKKEHPGTQEVAVRYSCGWTKVSKPGAAESLECPMCGKGRLIGAP